MIAPIMTMLTRERVAMAISIASMVPILPPASFRKSRASDGVRRAFRITVVFPGTAPAVTGSALASASWNMARTCGSSIGVLTRTSVSASQTRIYPFTGVPFFSEP